MNLPGFFSSLKTIFSKSTMIFYLLLSALTGNILAQSPDTLWTKNYEGISFNDVKETSSREYIIAARSSSGFGLLKTNTMGDSLWFKSYPNGWPFGGSAHTINETVDGGYILGGIYVTFGSPYDILVVKTNSSGESEWSKTFDISYYDSFCSVEQTRDGGYMLSGSTSNLILDVTNKHLKSKFLNRSQIQSSIHTEFPTAWLIKTDLHGDSLWMKSYPRSNSVESHTSAHSMHKTLDGGYVLAGSSTFGFIGTNDMWITKADSLGDTLWTMNYGYMTGSDDWASSITASTDSGYMVAGHTNEGGLLLKLNSAGDALWTKVYSGEFNSVIETSGNGYVIGGKFNGHPGLMRTNFSGTRLWQKTFPYLEGSVNSVQETWDGGYIIAGAKNTQGWLIRLAVDPSAIEGITGNIFDEYRLLQNYPNPFNPTTTIEFALAKAGRVSLKVYNPLGQEVSNLVSDHLSPGTYKYDWDAGGLASGVYYYRLEAGDPSTGSGQRFSQTKKLLLLK